eukprot:g10714.t1
MWVFLISTQLMIADGAATRCQCLYGIAATGDDCPRSGARKCVRCATGYTLDPEEHSCAPTVACGDRPGRAANKQLCAAAEKVFAPLNTC